MSSPPHNDLRPIDNLPDEILDLIIRAASYGPARLSQDDAPALPTTVSPQSAITNAANFINAAADKPATSSPDSSASLLAMDKTKLLVLGQVCVRWYNLTLPYIWRSVNMAQKHLVGSQSLTTFNVAPGGEEGNIEREKFDTFLDLVQARPLIAGLVEEVIFNTYETSMHTLATIINHLPNLRHLVLKSTWIQPCSSDPSSLNSLESVRTTMGGQSRTLESLYFDYNWHETRYDQAVIDIMSLFSTVNSLNLSMEPLFRQDIEPPELSVPDGSLQNMRVCELTVQHRVNTMRPWYTTLLRRLDVLSRLTCLEVPCAVLDTNAMKPVSDLVGTVAPTLQELCLCIMWSWKEPPTLGNIIILSSVRVADRDDVLLGLRDKLGLCKSLHGLRLKVNSTGVDHKAHNVGWMLLTPSVGASNYAPQDWLATVNLLTALPHPDQLKHFSFSFWSDRWTEDKKYAVERIRQFPWAKFRDVVRGLENLTSVVVCFVDQSPDAKLVHVAGETVKKEMEEFGAVLMEGGSSAFYVCKQKGCRWHGGRYIRSD